MDTGTEEITVRLLQNGKYIWTISANERTGSPTLIERLKQLDGKMRDAFPNHVKQAGIRFSEVSED